MAARAYDLYCGGGGSGLGLTQAGFDLQLAINHNPLAIATHQRALPATRHLCADVTQVEPLGFEPPDLLWVSAECTTFSPGRGPAAARARARRTTAAADVQFTLASRATGFDLLRWVDAHRAGLRVVVAENVLEWASWELFDTLRAGLARLGFDAALVHHNALLTGTATSRDRLFLVAWQADMQPPDLTVHAPAVCGTCGPVRGRQRYRRERRDSDHRFGEYGRHWALACPNCGDWTDAVVTPAAVILEEDPGPSLGTRQLKATTRARLRNAIAELAVPAAPVDDDVRRLIVLHWSKKPADRRHTADVGGSWWDASTRPLNTVTGVDSHSVLTIPTLAPGTKLTPAVIGRLEAAACHRMLTVPELARACGFPGDYPLEGTVRQRSIQLGMAVPPPMARWFGQRLLPLCEPQLAAA